MTQLFRKWDMPHKHTFLIPTVRGVLLRFVGNGKGWADPFANSHSPAEHTNDLNPETTATHHMDAVEFLKTFADESLDGVLLDPPYSLHQVTASYDGYGGARVNALTPVYDEASRAVKHGGIVICFGWNSNGLGADRGFLLSEAVLVPHGGHHNDTIITIEIKVKSQSTLFADQPGQGAPLARAEPAFCAAPTNTRSRYLNDGAAHRESVMCATPATPGRTW